MLDLPTPATRIRVVLPPAAKTGTFRHVTGWVVDIGWVVETGAHLVRLGHVPNQRLGLAVIPWEIAIAVERL
jgi:hypothetical protein